jgi:nitrate/TMAO reductase-like tetraheme cytochrome c subunit
VKARSVLGGLVLALGMGLLWLVFRPEPAAAEPRAFASSRECIACHAEPGAEWQASWHARSWNDPDVRALSNDFANADCIDCHASRPVFETGIGARVLPRNARRAEGVDCITCHLLPERAAGTVAGTVDVPSAPCRPVATTDLARAEFCAACHDQHQTVEQWKASRWAAEGIDCLDCHMPFRDGDPSRGRDHTMHGAHSMELLRQAVELRAGRDGRRLVVEVENVGAGHHFPTDERSRAADVFWRRTSEADAGPGGWKHLYRFRSPYRDEAGVEDTLLPAHETRRVTLEDAPAEALEVALFFKLTPYWEDPARPDPEREARLMFSVVVR